MGRKFLLLFQSLKPKKSRRWNMRSSLKQLKMVETTILQFSPLKSPQALHPRKRSNQLSSPRNKIVTKRPTTRLPMLPLHHSSLLNLPSPPRSSTNSARPLQVAPPSLRIHPNCPTPRKNQTVMKPKKPNPHQIPPLPLMTMAQNDFLFMPNVLLLSVLCPYQMRNQ